MPLAWFFTQHVPSLLISSDYQIFYPLPANNLPMNTQADLYNGIDIQVNHTLEALRKSEYLHQQVIQNLSAAIYTCDANGYITYYNKAAAELWGREPEIGKDLWCGSWKIFDPEDGKRVSLDECPMAKALKGRKSVRGEEIIVERPDGVRRNIMPHPDPIFDENGKVVAAVNMLVDITSLKKTENQLRESEKQYKQIAEELEKRVDERTQDLKSANQALQRSNEELEQFAFIASHDMQEPLRKIKTFSQRLAKKNSDVLDDTGKSYLEKIKNSADRMTGLINDVLNYSRFLYIDDQFVKTDLNQVLKDVLDDLEIVIEEKGAQVKSEDLPAVTAIPLLMNQLFHNLISNSLKFCREEESRCVIDIQARSLSPSEAAARHLNESFSYCEITVQDNGIGFKQEFAEAIFSIFKRLNTRDKYEGSGIGLALCRKIINTHRGDIFAKSIVGEGTTIHVILPLDLEKISG